MRISQDVALKEVPSLRIIRVILFNSFYCKMAVETDDLRIDDIAPINDRAVPTGGYDITGLITETRITESVHSYANFGKIDIVDARNLFEEALINGQERLYIEFEKYTYIDGEEIVDKFAKNYYVTKLFNYQKVNKKQIYSLEFVSPFAYKNLDRRISRSYCKDFPENVIYDIFVNDLEIPEKWVYKHPETSSYQLSFIIPNYRPFNAIQWVQKSIVSLLPSSGEAPIACPWVVYETFYSGIRIEPYANFKTGYSEEDTTGRSDKIITETFVDNLFFNYGFGSRDDFKQRKKRIIDLKSSFAFNKYDNTQNAAYGSNRYLLDVAQKTFYTDEDRDGQHCEYDYRNWPNAVTIEEYAPIAPHEFCNENAPKLQNSNYTYYVPYNSKLNGDEENTRPYNYQFGDEKNNSIQGQSKEMIMSNMNFMEHIMKVYGDLRYSPGKVVSIMIPKAVDTDFMPIEGDYRNGYDPKTIEDEYISGYYFITTVTHVIDHLGYFCEMVINRDSSPHPLEEY